MRFGVASCLARFAFESFFGLADLAQAAFARSQLGRLA
jgi:hypothetical protein